MKTTKKQFRYFKQRCEHWVATFALSDWSMGYYHDTLENNYAQCNPKCNTLVASITLSKDFGDVGSMPGYNIDDHLDRLAFQEVVHVMLEPLDDKCASVADMYMRHEAVAHRLERAFLGRKG